MTTLPSADVVQRNGRAATAEQLAPLAFAGYAHFTAMQLRGSQVRGLDLHLTRLREASMALFGRALPDERLCDYLRAALKTAPADLSLTIAVSSAEGEFTVAGPAVVPDILIRTGPASCGPAGPLALAVVEYERVLPTIKHVGEIAKTYFLRQAVAEGFDDAVFIDRQGRISEGTIWNLAFWDGEAVVWPVADILVGTTMSIVRRQLDQMGVPQRTQAIRLADVPTFSAAVVMNSWTPGIAISRIGAMPLPEATTFLALLHRAFSAETPVSF